MTRASFRPWTVAFASIVLAGAVAAFATDPPPGTYLETCTGATVQGDALAATCKRVDGSEQAASIPDLKVCTGDIWNIDGTLGCAQGAVPAGPYSQSCQYATIVDQVLKATCTVPNGIVEASLADYGKCLPGTINNIGGRLVCDVDGTPKGAYDKSCVGKSLSGGRLRALCKNRAGEYQPVSLASADKCVPNSISYTNGRLVCDWSEFPSGLYTKSCFFKRTNGTMLIASCLTKTGELQATSLSDYEDCRGGILNDNGDLRCSAP
jgi:hypothetical protein